MAWRTRVPVLSRGANDEISRRWTAPLIGSRELGTLGERTDPGVAPSAHRAMYVAEGNRHLRQIRSIPVRRGRY